MVERVDAREESTSLTRRSFAKGLTISTTATAYQRLVEKDPDNWRDKHFLRFKAAEVIDDKGILPYTEYKVSWDEYVGKVDLNLDQTVKNLQEKGYSYQKFSALKRHPQSDEYDDGSFRLLDEGGDKQWHIHLWEDEENSETQIFSHYEYKPEPWNVSKGAFFEEERTAEHILPKTSNYLQGQHSNELKDLIIENGSYAWNGFENKHKIGDADLKEPEKSLLHLI